ncbi:MAG: T9SS type A sorting domain-containing protein [Ignavibacteriales bacterium]|nr:T9SS type A sorting domain-containing protein [Ignavibacteriales bacterium]
MNQKLFKFASLLIFLMLFTTLLIQAEGEKKKQVSKIEGSPSYTHFTINNISTWIKNDGESDINPNGNSGLVYPKGSNKTAVFQTGFIYGGIVNGEVRVTGSAYRQGQVPGAIINGVVQDPDDPDVRIYRVKKYWDIASVADEVSLGEGNEQQVKAQYEKDWNEWPVEYGAPYTDVNGNGVYDPQVDMPGFPGADQTIWFVNNDYDASHAQFPYGSVGLGLEMQATIWGYANAGPLGNMFFRRYKIINKGGNTIDSMYVCLWSDPDLGDAGDDFIGCDVDKSLGYCYNGNATDGIYGAYPPAVGWDFFQGPIVPSIGDTAVFNNQYKYDYKNLPMSALFYFINPDPVYRDPEQGVYQGTLQFWNLFRGRVSTTGSPFIDPITGLPTKFCLNGDPVTQTGWVDGVLHPPADRRLGLVAGPFTMLPGDTQEVVVAEICAGGQVGTNNIQAVSKLRLYDNIAQDAYDKLFVLPGAPKMPDVRVSVLDEEIVLDWSVNLTRIHETETIVSEGYEFQGYNVYQLPNKSSTMDQAERIATYDIIDNVSVVLEQEQDPASGLILPVARQFGSNSGIIRYFNVTRDFINNAKLINGTSYFFAVTAYSYRELDPITGEESVPHSMESPLAIIEIIPQAEDAGTRYGTSTGDLVEAEHVEGFSDGQVFATVIDPVKITDHTYFVEFEADTNNGIYWNLKDSTTNSYLIEDYYELNEGEFSPVRKGFLLEVNGPPADFKNFQVVANANGPLDPPEMGTFAFNANGFPFLIDYNGNPIYDEDGDPIDRPSSNQQVGAGMWGICANGTSNALYDDFITRTTNYTGGFGEAIRGVDYLIPRDYEIRFTSDSSKAFFNWSAPVFVGKVPFQLWCTGADPNSTSDDYQCFPFILDNDANGVFNLTAIDHPVSGGTNDPQTDVIYWVEPLSRDAAGYDALVAAVENDPAGANAEYLWAYKTDYAPWYCISGMLRQVLVNWNGGDVNDTLNWPNNVNQLMPEDGTIFRILTNKTNQAGDVFRFSFNPTTYSTETAKEDLERINIYPNPYYGANPRELNKYQRFVTINHLPVGHKTNIKVYNLAGQLVRKFSSAGKQEVRWDLNNESGLPVASGMFLVHIEIPDYSFEKILKVGIIQEQQILDRF